MKSFEQYKKEGKIRKVSKDFERSESLKKEAKRKLDSLNERIEKIGIISSEFQAYRYALGISVVPPPSYRSVRFAYADAECNSNRFFNLLQNTFFLMFGSF